MDDQLTPERIAKHYSACLDSVWVINDAIANPDKNARLHCRKPDKRCLFIKGAD